MKFKTFAILFLICAAGVYIGKVAILDSRDYWAPVFDAALLRMGTTMLDTDPLPILVGMIGVIFGLLLYRRLDEAITEMHEIRREVLRGTVLILESKADTLRVHQILLEDRERERKWEQTAMSQETVVDDEVSIPVDMDSRPKNCRNRLRDEGKAHPKSGCAHCTTGGMTGCPYERTQS